MIALLFLIALAATAPPSPPRYHCTKTQSAVTVDGKLDDPAWQNAPWTEDFDYLIRRDRPPPPLRTRAKMLWDDQCLYVAAELSETDVRAEMHDHDSTLFQENAFEIFVDPDGDAKDYVELEFNALNTTFDLLMDKPYKQGGKPDIAWTCEGMKSAVQIDGTLNASDDVDRAWTIEVAIPWSGLSKLTPPPAAGSKWRVELARVEHRSDDRRAQYTAWSPTGESNLHVPGGWGVVEFVTAPDAARTRGPTSSQSSPSR